MLSQCLWGLGWAISSGADVAWITDELDRSDLIDRVLVAEGRRDLLGTVAGIVGFGALAWAASLSMAIAVAGVAMVVLGLVVVGRWPESRIPHHDTRRWEQPIAALRLGLDTARASRVIRLVLVGTLLINGGAMGFGRLLQERVISLGMPAAPAPIVWFAGIALAAAALGAFALARVEARIDGDGVATRVYVAACAVGAAGLGVFALAPNTASAVTGALLLSGLGLPTVRVAGTVLVNRRTASDARATVHSLLSQSENLGEAICGFALASLAASTSTTLTLLGSATLIAAAGLVVADTRTRRAEPTSTEAEAMEPKPD